MQRAVTMDQTTEAPEGLPNVGATSTARIEAFSDGIFAIVVTLLVLDIRLPSLTGPDPAQSLRRHLLAMLPLFLSYPLSFGIICI